MPTTTSEAGRYQQLRSHLAYLRLADAAEHLPAVLDTARTENLTTTAALERLLRDTQRESSAFRSRCSVNPTRTQRSGSSQQDASSQARVHVIFQTGRS